MPWWRRHRRVLLLLVAIAAAAVPLGRWGTAVVRRLEAYVAQSRAVGYMPAADRVVFRQVETTGQPRQISGAHRFRSFRGQADSPKPWADFARRAQLPLGPVLLVAKRDAGRGPRIVYVRLVGSYAGGFGSPAGTMEFCVAAHVLKPGSITSAASPPSSAPPVTGEVVGLAAGSPLRIYCGQVDPADPAHFTIACDAGIGAEGTGVREVLDGRLMPDDTVQITARCHDTAVGSAFQTQP